MVAIRSPPSLEDDVVVEHDSERTEASPATGLTSVATRGVKNPLTELNLDRARRKSRPPSLPRGWCIHLEGGRVADRRGCFRAGRDSVKPEEVPLT